jgi:hypothetical protein
MRKLIDPLSNEMISLTNRSKNEVYHLSPEKYTNFLERFNQHQHFDLLLVLGEDCIPVNKTLMAVHSRYFYNLLKELKEDTLDFKCYEQFGDARVFQVMANYLQSGCLVVPEELDASCWMLLHQLAEYFCLSSLVAQCQQEMILLLSDGNCQQLLKYSSENDSLSSLALHSAEMFVCTFLDKQQSENLYQLLQKESKNNSESIVAKLIEVVSFDLKQREMREERNVPEIMKRRSENNIEK